MGLEIDTSRRAMSCRHAAFFTFEMNAGIVFEKRDKVQRSRYIDDRGVDHVGHLPDYLEKSAVLCIEFWKACFVFFCPNEHELKEWSGKLSGNLFPRNQRRRFLAQVFEELFSSQRTVVFSEEEWADRQTGCVGLRDYYAAHHG